MTLPLYAWWVLVLLSYWLVVTASATTPAELMREVPGLEAADRAALPLLALVTLAGIIAYFGRGKDEAKSEAGDGSARAETLNESR